MGWGTVRLAIGCLFVSSLGCDASSTAEARPEEEVREAKVEAKAPKVVAEARSTVDAEGLLIGEFPLARAPVVDGDTIRVQGIDGSIRLLGIDTEEVFKGKKRRADAERDFAGYLRRARGDSRRPTKPGTFMGEEARVFADGFFGADSVRLERDDVRKHRGGFGRVLAYAFVQKDGRWTSYNIEAVRAGMSPYFTKYGYSHRFHNQFSRAEAEAREAKRGIWSPDAQGYGDYVERKAWWNARADFIRAFESEAAGRDDAIDLGRYDASEALERNLGREVTVLSTVQKIEKFKRLTRVSLSFGGNRPFPIIFFDRKVFQQTGVAAYVGEPVIVRGKVERYVKGEYQTLQIVVDNPAQVTLPELPSD